MNLKGVEDTWREQCPEEAAGMTIKPRTRKLWDRLEKAAKSRKRLRKKQLPKIPQLNFMGKQDYDFIQNIYLTMKAFMPENRIVDLRAHWRDNKRALDLLKRMDPGLHDQLIEDFKVRKAEIAEKNFAKKEEESSEDVNVFRGNKIINRATQRKRRQAFFQDLLFHFWRDADNVGFESRLKSFG